MDNPTGSICTSCGQQMSVAGSTIETNQQKGNEMETPIQGTVTPMEADTYNPNLLVTYKSINNGEVTYPTLKVNQLEMHLDSYRRLQDQLAISNGQISRILDNLSAEGWYSSSTDKEEVLRDLCEILGHEPKQTVRITATVNVEVDYDIPLDEAEDFDAHYFLQDNLTIDSWHGDVVIESWTVEESDVDWDN